MSLKPSSLVFVGAHNRIQNRVRIYDRGIGVLRSIPTKCSRTSRRVCRQWIPLKASGLEIETLNVRSTYIITVKQYFDVINVAYAMLSWQNQPCSAFIWRHICFRGEFPLFCWKLLICATYMYICQVDYCRFVLTSSGVVLIRGIDLWGHSRFHYTNY